jgi:branched-chain amino acid transport system permease protein
MRRPATAWLALLAALGVGAVVAPLVLPPHIVTLLSLVFIAGLLAASVDLLAGLVGLVSIGHAGIAAAAGYAVAWATLREHGVVVQLGLALAVTLVVSAVYALTTMRTNGIVFLMITLALGIVVYGLALKLSTITGGQNGLTGVRRPDAIADPVAFYFVAAAAFAVAAAFRWVLARSPFGLVLRGARESESRMSSLGYSVARAKFVAVMLSGLLAGIAGVLIVWQAQFMSPNVASFSRSAMAVVMVILGGAGSLLGPLVGAGLVVGTEHWLSSYVERWPTLLGLVFIAVVLFAPGGVVGALAGRGRGGMPGRRSTAGPGASAAGGPLLEEEPLESSAPEPRSDPQ